MRKRLAILALVLLCFSAEKFSFGSSPETISQGSFIVNTGVTPQTFNTGLKPYGLIYDLIKNYRVPIKWSINDTKVRDGVDFVYNSVNYRGGPFIIPAEYITPAITSRITYWQGQGVVGVYTNSPITVPVFATITNFPVIMIDSLSNLQSIIQNYYVLAGIPSNAYTIGAPAGLTQCYDIWTNPHGDPTWETHGALYNFVTQIKGWIWGQCHAISMLEDVVNPSPPNEQLNFLTLNGLKCWQSGGCGAGFTEFHTLAAASPFTYYYPTDPEMQFMADMHLATQAGSERWYHPISSGGWRPETKVGVSTATGAAPAQGVLAVYGDAYGDTSYGRVMYIAGHDLTSGGGGAAVQSKVSSIRMYFNFMLLAGKDRELYLTASFMPPDTMNSTGSSPISVTVTAGTPPYTYQWTSENGGTFADPTADSTTYYPPQANSNTYDIVRVAVTDQCGRVNFVAKRIFVIGDFPLPVTLVNFSGENVPQGIRLGWSTASEFNNDYFTLERSSENESFEPMGTVDGAGNSNSLLNYSWMDIAPQSGTNYYRLVQTDFDGGFTTYGPISVRMGDTPFSLSVINVYPNPATGDFYLTYRSEDRTETLLEILNAEGKKVYSEILTSLRGTNFIEIKDEKLAAKGIYFVRLSQGKTKSHAERIVKK